MPLTPTCPARRRRRTARRMRHRHRTISNRTRRVRCRRHHGGARWRVRAGGRGPDPGLVPEHDLTHRIARNAVWDRIGNLTIAALVGIIGYWWTQRATFYLVPAFAVISAAVVLTIPPHAIDHDRARGFAPGQHQDPPQGFLQLLLDNRPLLLLAAIAATFHFANSSMLPLVGQKLAIAHPGYESVLTSACILIAQAVTIPVAMIVGLKADEWGLKVLLTGACVALALRGAVFAMADTAPVLLAAQVLDGIAGGVWDVLVPLLIADFVVGSGRYSTSRGVLGTVQGIGGSLSNAAAGALAVWAGIRPPSRASPCSRSWPAVSSCCYLRRKP